MNGKILIVDDNPAVCKFLEHLLRSQAFETVTAGDGQTALDKFLRFQPDLVLLDVVMRGLNGYEVCRRIKSNPNTRLTPVVLISALSTTYDRTRSHEAGADGFLNKPFDTRELLGRLRSLLSLKAHTHELDESDKYGGNPFFEMKTVAGIVTFGCNIPVFSLAYDQIRCIIFPDPALERYFPGRSGEEVRRAAKWLNFYDPDDVLGFPLKPLSPSYNTTVTEDVAINVGGILSFWNPLSHLKYWTDNDFTKPVARFLAGILQLL